MAWDMKEAVDYYKKQGAPGDQSALLSLLREIQQEQGGAIPQYMLREVAAMLSVKESYLLAIIRRIPSLRLKDQHCLELCAGVNCGKHVALADYAAVLQVPLSVHSGSWFTAPFHLSIRSFGVKPTDTYTIFHFC